MTEQTTTTETTTEPTVLDQIANRPLLFDKYPVEDGANSINLWAREGDDLATIRISQDEDETETIEIDIPLTTDELFYLGESAGIALAKLGDRSNLIGLIEALVNELGAMK